MSGPWQRRAYPGRGSPSWEGQQPAGRAQGPPSSWYGPAQYGLDHPSGPPPYQAPHPPPRPQHSPPLGHVRGTAPRPQPCFNCGGLGHWAQECPGNRRSGLSGHFNPPFDPRPQKRQRQGGHAGRTYPHFSASEHRYGPSQASTEGPAPPTGPTGPTGPPAYIGRPPQDDPASVSPPPYGPPSYVSSSYGPPHHGPSPYGPPTYAPYPSLNPQHPPRPGYYSPPQGPAGPPGPPGPPLHAAPAGPWHQPDHGYPPFHAPYQPYEPPHLYDPAPYGQRPPDFPRPARARTPLRPEEYRSQRQRSHHPSRSRSYGYNPSRDRRHSYHSASSPRARRPTHHRLEDTPPETATYSLVTEQGELSPNEDILDYDLPPEAETKNPAVRIARPLPLDPTAPDAFAPLVEVPSDFRGSASKYVQDDNVEEVAKDIRLSSHWDGMKDDPAFQEISTDGARIPVSDYRRRLTLRSDAPSPEVRGATSSPYSPPELASSNRDGDDEDARSTSREAFVKVEPLEPENVQGWDPVEAGRNLERSEEEDTEATLASLGVTGMPKPVVRTTLVSRPDRPVQQPGRMTDNYPKRNRSPRSQENHVSLGGRSHLEPAVDGPKSSFDRQQGPSGYPAWRGDNGRRQSLATIPPAAENAQARPTKDDPSNSRPSEAPRGRNAPSLAGRVRPQPEDNDSPSTERQRQHDDTGPRRKKRQPQVDEVYSRRWL